MLATKRVAVHNFLLDALPRRDRERLLTACEQVTLNVGQVLNEPGDRIRHVYFPTESFISVVMRLGNNEILEVGLVGNEGMHGLSVLLGVDRSSSRALVQGAGKAWRLSAAQFRRVLGRSRALELALHRYSYVVMAGLAQTAVCNRFHVVEERLARWLLLTRDGAHANQFYVTHEFLAYMLGVRRVGVTKAAGSLQRKKLISYSRGNLKILDRRGLEAASCVCYQAGQDMYARVLG